MKKIWKTIWGFCIMCFSGFGYHLKTIGLVGYFDHFDIAFNNACRCYWRIGQQARKKLLIQLKLAMKALAHYLYAALS